MEITRHKQIWQLIAFIATGFLLTRITNFAVTWWELKYAYKMPIVPQDFIASKTEELKYIIIITTTIAAVAVFSCWKKKYVVALLIALVGLLATYFFSKSLHAGSYIDFR